MVKKKEMNVIEQICGNIADSIPKGIDTLENSWKSLFVGKSKKKIKKSGLKKKEIRKRSFWAIFGLVCLNLFIVLSLWISLFSAIISLFVTGISISISGLAVILYSLFFIILPITFSLQGLFGAGIFAGIGLLLFGIIFSILSWKLGKYFFILTAKYLKWNGRVFSGSRK